MKLRPVGALIGVTESGFDNSFDLDRVQGRAPRKVLSSHATTTATRIGLCSNDASRAVGRGPWTIWRVCGPTRFRGVFRALVEPSIGRLDQR